MRWGGRHMGGSSWRGGRREVMLGTLALLLEADTRPVAEGVLVV